MFQDDSVLCMGDSFFKEIFFQIIWPKTVLLKELIALQSWQEY